MKMMTVIGVGQKRNKGVEHKLNIQNLVAETWKEVLPKVNELYPNFPHGFDVKLNARLRTTGGRVLFERGCPERKGKMELNEKLLATNLDQVRMVFIHELAHLIQYHMRGWSDHGSEFKAIMESLGCSATTYMPKGLEERLGAKPKKEYIYECEEGCVHVLDVRKHNRMLKGRSIYSCKRSKKDIKFKEVRVKQKSIIG